MQFVLVYIVIMLVYYTTLVYFDSPANSDQAMLQVIVAIFWVPVLCCFIIVLPFNIIHYLIQKLHGK